MTNRKYIILLLNTLLAMLFISACRKEEKVYEFINRSAPPPASSKDTAISTTAKLNGSSFAALGRSLAPDGSIRISFFDFNSAAFLEVVLGADTPGTYLMGRSISANTAVYYKDELNKKNKTGFTSRATEEAGGKFIITSVDDSTHRIQGTFELLLLSRTQSDRYEFASGAFNIQYNYAELQLDDSLVTAKTLDEAGLQTGNPVSPAPSVYFNLPDSLTLNVKAFQDYKGPGIYAIAAGGIILTDNKNKKQYKSVSGSAQLLRYNYGQFMQALFDAELKADDGTVHSIKNGIFVLGNTQ